MVAVALIHNKDNFPKLAQHRERRTEPRYSCVFSWEEGAAPELRLCVRHWGSMGPGSGRKQLPAWPVCIRVTESSAVPDC